MDSIDILKGRHKVTLEDTVALMVSDDFRDRLKAEYIQLVLRMRGCLARFDSLDPRTCAEGQWLNSQLIAMGHYRDVLRSRMYDQNIRVELIDDLLREE